MYVGTVVLITLHTNNHWRNLYKLRPCADFQPPPLRQRYWCACVLCWCMCVCVCVPAESARSLTYAVENDHTTEKQKRISHSTIPQPHQWDSQQLQVSIICKYLCSLLICTYTHNNDFIRSTYIIRSIFILRQNNHRTNCSHSSYEVNFCWDRFCNMWQSFAASLPSYFCGFFCYRVRLERMT